MCLMFRRSVHFLAPLGVLSLAPIGGAAILSGTISDWNESAEVRAIGDGTNHVSFWWSINSLEPQRGWFYGSVFTGDSDVAWAQGATDISDITDAESFNFTSTHVDKGITLGTGTFGNDVGDFLVFRNNATHHYGVFRPDSIYRVNPNNPEIGFNTALTGTWWFQTDGTGNFSAVPEPATLAGLGIGCAALLRRRRARL